MSKTEKIKAVLGELEAIETIIKPYEWHSTEVSSALEVIAKFKESLKDPEHVDLYQVLEYIEKQERRLDYYRGEAAAEEVIGHIQRIKKIIGEA